ncbi:MAG: ribose-phosphate diphosphokinase, partial [Exiguobacterium chiriqhucha]
TVAGATRLITMDLHAAQIQGFFNIPVDQLLGVPLISTYFETDEFKAKDIVVVSPDHGGVTRARKLAERLKAPIAIIDKRRPEANVAEVMNIVGSVEGKTAILIDDIIDTAGTITLAADAIVQAGAKEVYASCTHPVLSGPAMERIDNSSIKELVVLNTIDLEGRECSSKIKQMSVARLLGEAIMRVHEHKSVSTLFD